MGDSTFGGLFPSGLSANLEAINPFSGSETTKIPQTQVSAAGNPSTVMNTSPAPSSGGGIMNLLSGGKGIGGLLSNLSKGVSIGSGLNTLVQGPGKIPYKSEQLSNSMTLQNQGNQLINTMTTGTLPAGQEQKLSTDLQNQIAQIKAKYANMNLTGSTMEQQEIQAAENQSNISRGQLAQKATETGMSMLGSSSDVLNNIANQQAALDKEYQDALASLAEAGFGSLERED